ncbi:MAG: Kazal-type serine protease inhibitor [Saprospiraceae bacterium]
MKNLLLLLIFVGILIFNSSCTKDEGDCVCIEIYAPVCGDDGKTYSNSCYAECAGVTFSEGACPIETNAKILDLGDPALDGCGWVVQFEVDGTLENHRADSLPTNFLQHDLEVTIEYQPTTEESICGLIDMIPVIELVNIEVQ